MSLHINLLLDEERSNPSGKILHTTAYAFAAVIVIGTALWVLQTFLMLQSSQSALARAQRRSDEMKQSHKTALGMIADIAEAKEYLGDITAFSNAQIAVSSRLYAVAVCVPDSAQITSLKITSELVAGGAKNTLPARQYSGEIAGRTKGDGVEKRLKAFITEMNNADGLLGKVTPGGVSVDAANSSDRIFDIRFALAPLCYKLDTAAGGSK